jgi:hypothetical protein
MLPSAMLRCEVIIKTEASVERKACFMRLTRIGEPETTVVGSPILVVLMIEVIRSSESLILTRVPLRHFSEDGILHSHSRENFKSYIILTGWAL